MADGLRRLACRLFGHSLGLIPGREVQRRAAAVSRPDWYAGRTERGCTRCLTPLRDPDVVAFPRPPFRCRLFGHAWRDRWGEPTPDGICTKAEFSWSRWHCARRRCTATYDGLPGTYKSGRLW